MFQDPAPRAHLPDGKDREVPFVGSRLSKVSEPAPRPTWRMTHDWASTWPSQRVPVGIPHVCAGDAVINRIGPGKQDSDCGDLWR